MCQLDGIPIVMLATESISADALRQPAECRVVKAKLRAYLFIRKALPEPGEHEIRVVLSAAVGITPWATEFLAGALEQRLNNTE